jgi:hypothetical protein
LSSEKVPAFFFSPTGSKLLSLWQARLLPSLSLLSSSLLSRERKAQEGFI